MEEMITEQENGKAKTENSLAKLTGRLKTLEEKRETVWQEEEIAQERYNEYYLEQEGLKEKEREARDRKEEGEHRREVASRLKLG